MRACQLLSLMIVTLEIITCAGCARAGTECGQGLRTFGFGEEQSEVVCCPGLECRPRERGDNGLKSIKVGGGSVQFCQSKIRRIAKEKNKAIREHIKTMWDKSKESESSDSMDRAAFMEYENMAFHDMENQDEKQQSQLQNEMISMVIGMEFGLVSCIGLSVCLCCIGGSVAALFMMRPKD